MKRTSSTVQAGSALGYRSFAMDNLTVGTTVMRRPTGGWKTHKILLGVFDQIHQQFFESKGFGWTYRGYLECSSSRNYMQSLESKL